MKMFSRILGSFLLATCLLPTMSRAEGSAVPSAEVITRLLDEGKVSRDDPRRAKLEKILAWEQTPQRLKTDPAARETLAGLVAELGLSGQSGDSGEAAARQALAKVVADLLGSTSGTPATTAPTMLAGLGQGMVAQTVPNNGIGAVTVRPVLTVTDPWAKGAAIAASPDPQKAAMVVAVGELARQDGVPSEVQKYAPAVAAVALSDDPGKAGIAVGANLLAQQDGVPKEVRKYAPAAAAVALSDDPGKAGIAVGANLLAQQDGVPKEVQKYAPAVAAVALSEDPGKAAIAVGGSMALKEAGASEEVQQLGSAGVAIALSDDPGAAAAIVGGQMLLDKAGASEDTKKVAGVAGALLGSGGNPNAALTGLLGAQQPRYQTHSPAMVGQMMGAAAPQPGASATAPIMGPSSAEEQVLAATLPTVPSGVGIYLLEGGQWQTLSTGNVQYMPMEIPSKDKFSGNSAALFYKAKGARSSGVKANSARPVFAYRGTGGEQMVVCKAVIHQNQMQIPFQFGGTWVQENIQRPVLRFSWNDCVIVQPTDDLMGGPDYFIVASTTFVSDFKVP